MASVKEERQKLERKVLGNLMFVQLLKKNFYVKKWKLMYLCLYIVMQVIYLENDNVLLENKQKELKGTLNNLLQSRENFVNAYEVIVCDWCFYYLIFMLPHKPW